MTTMIKESSEVQRIVKVVENTQVINTEDINEVVELQDLFNVNALQAKQVVEMLDREGRRKLLWIITTVSGQDTFEFWFKHGIADPWAEKTAYKIQADVEESYREWEVELLDRERQITLREADVKQQAIELDKREADLRHREGLAEIDVQRRVGNQVKLMRQHLRELQARLEEEQALNRKAKKLARLVEKI